MTDTELLDYLESARRVPMPAFDVQPSTGGASNARFVGWSTNGETTYPTLREAVIAMAGIKGCDGFLCHH